MTKKTRYDRDRDWPINAFGITGLRENLGRDGGIEEPYWGPSAPETCQYRPLWRAEVKNFVRKIFKLGALFSILGKTPTNGS